MLTWTRTPHCPRYPLEHIIGLVSTFLSESDARFARQQLHDGYTHGGGWHPLPGWTFSKGDRSIKYPGDPRLRPWAYAKLHDDLILVYPHAWFCILHPDGTFEVARMD